MTTPYKRYEKVNRGAAFSTILFVIVMISILSIVGVSSVQNSTLHAEIARNIQQKQAAFRNADAVVGLLEIDYAQQVRSCLEDKGSCAIDFSPTYRGEDKTVSEAWVDSEVVSGVDVNFGEGVVEYMGRKPIPGDSEREVHFYRINARAFERPMDDSGNFASDLYSETLAQSMIRVCARVDGSGSCNVP